MPRQQSGCLVASIAIFLFVINSSVSAGRKLNEDIKQAIADKRPLLEVPRGVYRLSEEPLQIQGSENFTIRGPGVELLVDGIGKAPTVGRVLWNTNFILEGGAGNDVLPCNLHASQRLQPQNRLPHA